MDGLQPSLAGGHPCRGCPLPPHPSARAAPRQGRGGGSGRGQETLPARGAAARGPPASSTRSEGFIPLTHSRNKKGDVYPLGSGEPKQNTAFCTGGSYLWLVAKADNASSRDLPALCNKAIAHHGLIGISSGQLNQGAGRCRSSAAEPRAECSREQGLCWGRRCCASACPGRASARQGFQSTGAMPKPLALIH